MTNKNSGTSVLRKHLNSFLTHFSTSHSCLTTCHQLRLWLPFFGRRNRVLKARTQAAQATEAADEEDLFNEETPGEMSASLDTIRNHFDKGDSITLHDLFDEIEHYLGYHLRRLSSLLPQVFCLRPNKPTCIYVISCHYPRGISIWILRYTGCLPSLGASSLDTRLQSSVIFISMDSISYLI